MMKTSKHIVIALLLVLTTASFSFGYGYDMRDIYRAIPDSLTPYLTTNNRLDMLDFKASGMRAEVSNLLGGTSEMTELTDTSLTVRMSDALTTAMLLLSIEPNHEHSQKNTDVLKDSWDTLKDTTGALKETKDALNETRKTLKEPTTDDDLGEPVDTLMMVVCVVNIYGSDSLSLHSSEEYYTTDWKKLDIKPTFQPSDELAIARLKMQTIQNWNKEKLKKD